MLENALTLIVLGQLAIMSPGPDCLLVVRNSLALDRQKALMTVLGIMLGVALHLFYIVAGVEFVRPGTPFHGSLQICGILYLSYLGVKLLLSALEKRGEPGSNVELPGEGVTNTGAFVQGFVCNAANPKVVLFFVSMLSQFIDGATPLTERLVYAAVLWGQAFVYWMILALLVHRLAPFVGGSKYARVSDAVFGVAMLVFAASLGLR